MRNFRTDFGAEIDQKGSTAVIERLETENKNGAAKAGTLTGPRRRAALAATGAGRFELSGDVGFEDAARLLAGGRRRIRRAEAGSSSISRGSRVSTARASRCCSSGRWRRAPRASRCATGTCRPRSPRSRASATSRNCSRPSRAADPTGFSAAWRFGGIALPGSAHRQAPARPRIRVRHQSAPRRPPHPDLPAPPAGCRPRPSPSFTWYSRRCSHAFRMKA